MCGAISKSPAGSSACPIWGRRAGERANAEEVFLRISGRPPFEVDKERRQGRGVLKTVLPRLGRGPVQVAVKELEGALAIDGMPAAKYSRDSHFTLAYS